MTAWWHRWASSRWPLPREPARNLRRPLATVVIGGICLPPLLTLLVLPILYRLAHRPDEEMEDVTAEPVHPAGCGRFAEFISGVFRSDS